MRSVELSRLISHALRHEPWLYELELDDEGWVAVEELLTAVRAARPQWEGVDESALRRMMAEADRQRFELAEGRIRALYGHSVPGRLDRRRAAPPAVLFHGTSPAAWRSIRTDGLRPARRQYVHLSTDVDTARQVGRRKAREPVMVRVDAARAHADGVPFYVGNERVWLANHVPSRFLTEAADSVERRPSRR
ncbi:MAG: RNA 2'-phosphotransferase [Actinobacteria bacterium]|nr:RNA 2'-phosphotransferase [Actinomycetota bacterium]